MATIDPDAAAFGRRLQEARDRVQLTQTQAAAELASRGVKSRGKATVSAWEVGRSLPSPLVMRTLCRLYNCSADSLLWPSPDEVPGPTNTLPPDLLRRIAVLSPEQRAALVRNIEATLDLLAPAAPAAPAALGTKHRHAA